jgi:hypothetical protein
MACRYIKLTVQAPQTAGIAFTGASRTIFGLIK